MASWDLLDDKDELELHKSRLLNIEEKPFKRITKRLSDVSHLAKARPAQQPTPPAEGGANTEENSHGEKKDPAAIRRQLDQLVEDLTLDFAAFDSQIARLQFLFDANVRERDRYTKSKQSILEASETVRANNTQLRQQLEAARDKLAQRKKFDELAEKIAKDKDAKPRDETLATTSKLEEECRELKVESEKYSETWKERRDQFNRIMNEGRLLRQLIRDDKEEVERREGMNEDGEEDGEASRGGQTPKHIPSGNATPRPDSGTISRADGDVGTPRPAVHSGGRTPARDSQDDGMDGLRPPPEGLGLLSRNGSRVPSRDVSPNPGEGDDEIEEGEDVEMSVVNTQATGETPHITIDAPGSSEDKMEVDNN
jgi:Tho complex subunit 7